MQKELSLLDSELQLNHLIRLPDPISKPSHSFFRAISISLFSNISETQYVKSVMRLTLQTNCEIYEQSGQVKKRKKLQHAFPLISQNSQLIKKFTYNKQMLERYWYSQDLQCFQNDNYEIACLTFNRRVSIYFLNKQGYLNQTIISSCRNKSGKKIILAKVGKRYFAVQKETSQIVGNFIRENILANVIMAIFKQQIQMKEKGCQEKYLELCQGDTYKDKNKNKDNEKQTQKYVINDENLLSHYNFDQNKDKLNENDVEKENVNNNSQSYTTNQQQNINQTYLLPPHYYQNEFTGYEYLQHVPIMYANQYYPYYDQHLQSGHEAYSAYTQQQSPQELVQNNRYRGRLKFFDMNGKYGFIIVDGIESDIFVHYDDLSKAGISKDQLVMHVPGRELRFEFTYYEYEGKNKKAKKAIDLCLLTQN